MDKLKKLLQYSPFLIPIIFALIIFCILGKCYSYTFQTQGDYMGTICQINLPAKDLKIYLIDTTICLVEPFYSYAINNSLIIKKYCLAGVRISSGAILKEYFFSDLATLKQRAIQYAKTHNINLKFKKLKGKFSQTWMRSEIE